MDLFSGAEPPAPSADDRLVALYTEQGRTLDDLPYTPEFARIMLGLAAHGDTRSPHEVFHKLHNLRKAGKLPRLGKAQALPAKLNEEEETLLASLVEREVGSLGQRDQLPLTDRFDAIAAAFNQRIGRDLEPHTIWRLIAKLAK